MSSNNNNRKNDLTYSVKRGEEVTEEDLQACADLFSHHYGVWGPKVSSPLIPGSRVTMNAKRLRDQCLADPKHTVLALCKLVTSEEEERTLVGHAFASVWQYNGSNICWVTQLIVSSDQRKRSIASGLLQRLPGQDFELSSSSSRSRTSAFGIVSTHPAACIALYKRAGAKVCEPDLEFMKAHAQAILNMADHIPYLKNSHLCGSLFQKEGEEEEEHKGEGVICTVPTEFYADHKDALAALKAWEEAQGIKWPLGVLPEGHEFLCIVPNLR